MFDLSIGFELFDKNSEKNLNNKKTFNKTSIFVYIHSF